MPRTIDPLGLEEQLLNEIGGQRSHEREWIDEHEREWIDERERKRTDEHVREWMESAGAQETKSGKSGSDR